MLLPKDMNDGKNVIVEIRSGAGGEEAALFAHSLLRMYTMYVQSRGWKLEMLNLNETELGGVKEAIFSVDGAGAYNRLKYESGVHRVQRVPETETQGRIHTSTATVAVMPQADARTSAASSRTRIRHWRSCAAACWHKNRNSSRTPSIRSGRGRWAPATAARRSVPITSRRTAAPTTASA